MTCLLVKTFGKSLRFRVCPLAFALCVSWTKYNALAICFGLHSVDRLYSTLSSCATIRISLRFGIVPIVPFRIQVLWQHLFSVNLPNYQFIPLIIVFDDSISTTSLHHIDNFLNQCSQFPQIPLVAFVPSLDLSRYIFNLWFLKLTLVVVSSHELRSLRYPELRCDLLNLKRLMEDTCFDFKG